MADEITKEDVVEEETKITSEAIAVQAAFDDKIDGDEDDSTEEDVEDGEEEVAEEDTAKEDATEEPVTGMEAEIDALEAKIEADSLKTAEQKAAEKAEAEQKAAEEAEEAEKAKEAPYDCGLSTEEDEDGNPGFEPVLVAALNKQGQAMQDRAKAAESKNAELASMIQRQAAQRDADWLDSKFNSLGEHFEEVLGFGDFEDLEPTVQQNRIAVSKRIAAINAAYLKSGKPLPSRSKKFEMAVSKLFTKEINKPEAELKTAEKLAARKRQVIGRGSKKGTALTAAEIAINKQKAFDAKIDE